MRSDEYIARWEIKADDHVLNTWLICRGTYEQLEIFASGLSLEQATAMLKGLRDLEDPRRQERIDEFAKAALTGFISRAIRVDFYDQGALEKASVISWAMAEAMEVEREKRSSRK